MWQWETLERTLLFLFSFTISLFFFSHWTHSSSLSDERHLPSLHQLVLSTQWQVLRYYGNMNSIQTFMKLEYLTFISLSFYIFFFPFQNSQIAHQHFCCARTFSQRRIWTGLKTWNLSSCPHSEEEQQFWLSIEFICI